MAVAAVFFTITDEIQTQQAIASSYRFKRLLHGLLSSAIQLSTLRIPKVHSIFSPDCILMVYLPALCNGCILSQIWSKNHFDLDTTHLGLAVANAITLAGGFLLRWDRSDTERALDELNQARYHYKSL
jgi:hypothetical protein